MKQSRFTARLISVAAAVLFAFSAAAPVFAESDSDHWISPLESQTDATEPDPEEEDPEEPEETAPENTEPEETEPAAALDPEVTNEPEDPEDPEDSETPEETENTEAPVTAAPPALPAATYTPEAEQTMYAPQVINIRSGPGTDYDKVGVLYANSEITVIGSSGEWAAVSYNGTTGYILRSLLSSTPPATTTPAPETETAPPQSEETSPEETSPPETEPTESEWQTPEMIQPVETTAPVVVPEETTTREPAPAASAQPIDGGGLSPFLIALLSAAAAFLLIGALPVFIHSVHHKNLYRY